MKSIILLILGVLITLASCNTEETKIIIEGQITGDIPQIIEYSIPINNLCHSGISGSTEPDSNGRFTITMNIDEPAIISFHCPSTVGYLIAEPRHKYKINIELAVKNKKFHVTGNAKTAQKIFNDFYNRNGHIILFQKLVRDIVSYSPHKTATQITDSLLLQKTEEIAKFDELYEEGSISKEFNDIVKNDRNCFYSSLLATIGYWKTVFRKKNINRGSPFFKMAEKYYSDVQINYNDYRSSPVFYWAIWHYCQYIELSDTSFNASIYKDIYEKKIIHTHHIEVAEKYLSKGLSDIYKILYFTKACKQNKFEVELISVYNNLKKEQRNEIYKPYLTQLINPIQDYHRARLLPLNPNIKMVSTKNDMNSTKDLFEIFNGEHVYVDVWATWCGPCKREFGQKKELENLLKRYDIKIL